MKRGRAPVAPPAMRLKWVYSYGCSRAIAMTGETAPTNNTSAPATSAARPSGSSRRAIQAPASPPSTANGGSTKTKWRMPLYIAGRAAMVMRMGSVAASTTARSAARCPAEPPRSRVGHGDDRAGDAAKPERQQYFRQLQRGERRHVAARHIGNRDQLPVEQLAPRLFEKIGKIFDGMKRIERRDDAPRPDQAHDQIGQYDAWKECEEE